MKITKLLLCITLCSPLANAMEDAELARILALSKLEYEEDLKLIPLEDEQMRQAIEASLMGAPEKGEAKEKEQEPEGNGDTLLKNYHHISVQGQVNSYREIYAKLPKGVKIDESTYVPGLLNVFTNGVALVHDLVLKREWQSEVMQQQALERLTKFYKIAVQLDQEQRLNAATFITLNVILARIADYYKGVNFKSFPLNIDELTIEDFTSTSYLTFTPSVLMPEGASFDSIPMVIYKMPKSKKGIGYKTFVDQMLNHDLKGQILLFDIDSVPYEPDMEKGKYGSKKDAHNSSFNGTTRMLTHDLSHWVEQKSLEQCLRMPFSLGVNWRENLQRINAYRLGLDQGDSKYMILTNALFMLSHELFNITAITPRYPHKNLVIKTQFSDAESNFSAHSGFMDVVRFIQHVMIERTLLNERISNGGMYGYKEQFRDHENILKNAVDMEGNPFFPEVFKGKSGEEKQKLISAAFTHFWDEFFKIVAP